MYTVCSDSLIFFFWGGGGGGDISTTIYSVSLEKKIFISGQLDNSYSSESIYLFFIILQLLVLTLYRKFFFFLFCSVKIEITGKRFPNCLNFVLPSNLFRYSVTVKMFSIVIHIQKA